MSNVAINGVVVGEFVSRSAGWVTFCTPGGAIKKARGATVTVDQTSNVEAAQPAREDDMSKTKTAKGKASKPAKTAKASKPRVAKPQGEIIRRCKDATFDLARYVKGKSPSGATTYDNGDKVAAQLRGKTLDEVYEFVARAQKEAGEADTIGGADKALRSRYAKLNAGMQRMNLGNRLRALI